AGNKYISSVLKTETQYSADLKNIREHGITNTIIYDDLATLDKTIKLREKTGIGYSPLYIIGVGADSTGERQQAVLDIARKHNIREVYFYGADEAEGELLTKQRKKWQELHDLKAKIMVTGFLSSNYRLMGDIQDLFICFGYPSNAEAGKWHSRNHKIWLYAYPFSGVLNPELFRRNYGLLAWKNSYDGICPFAYQQCGSDRGSIWNSFDFVKTVRDQNFAYPTLETPINTVPFEGLREGIKDIKYASTLQQLIAQYKKSAKGKAGKNVLAAEDFLRNLDVDTGDLNVIRNKIIDYIIKLKQ
ncbi:MAG: hypothetical protein PHV82_13870, partial [Victivallaceae bacterium]|nr:hypothetical protein [Victivallaceae bacterium]